MKPGLVLRPADIRRWAEFSDGRHFRFLLGREWDASLPRVMWIGANPSIADEHRDDMTATKYVEFSRRAGFGSYEAVNWIPLVATNPSEVPNTHPRTWLPVDVREANVRAWNMALVNSAAVIVACGGLIGDGVARIANVLSTWDKPILCLGLTRSGHPRHASRAAYSTPLVPFEVRR